MSHVQRFYQYCKVSKISISCRVTDKGRPVLLGNMTFTWTAPTIDFGTIRCLLPVNNANSSSMKICLSANKYILFSFVLSVVKGNRYTEVSSKPITFNAFPVSIRGFKIVKFISFHLFFLARCGRQFSCFRRCTSQPTCPADQSDFMVVIDLTRLATCLTPFRSQIWPFLGMSRRW